MRTAGRVDSRVDRAHRVIAAKGWVFEGAVLDGSEGWTAQIDGLHIRSGETAVRRPRACRLTVETFIGKQTQCV